MASAVDPAGEPIPTSAAKHIHFNCQAENVAFLKCDKCLDKGRQVTRCVLTLLKDLHQRCTAEMDGYVGCMYYNTNECDLCRKEQEEFENKRPLASELHRYPPIIPIVRAVSYERILSHTFSTHLVSGAELIFAYRRICTVLKHD